MGKNDEKSPEEKEIKLLEGKKPLPLQAYA